MELLLLIAEEQVLVRVQVQALVMVAVVQQVAVLVFAVQNMDST